MSSLKDRETAFENKFKYEQDLLFKTNCRRAKLVGEWAAERLGIQGEEVEDYIYKIVVADVCRPGHREVIDKLQADFKERGSEISDHRIRQQFERQWHVARQQVATSN